MRVMVIIMANAESEAGNAPSEELLAEMGDFNEELANAGIMQAGEGLLPSSIGARVKFSGSKRSVVNGPFPDARDLVAGFWIWKVGSMEEAIEWVRRIPNPTGQEGVVEVRQIAEAEDFGDAMTPEIRAQEDRVRATIERQAT